MVLRWWKFPLNYGDAIANIDSSISIDRKTFRSTDIDKLPREFILTGLNATNTKFAQPDPVIVVQTKVYFVKVYGDFSVQLSTFAAGQIKSILLIDEG
ncbi:hypothetical protein NSTC745_04793 [Nostoc sp. DSM 114161]|jgi:hypothetical protein